MSLGYSISATLGTAIGQEDVLKAKKILKITLIMTFLVTVFVIQMTMLNLEGIISIYLKREDDPEVFDLAIPCLAAYCLAYIFDSIQLILCSTVKGLGLQARAQKIAIASFFLQGLPCAYLAGFVYGYKIVGLWIGFTLGLIMMCILYSLMLFELDW